MREILYKAKRIDNKEWVFGSLIIRSGKAFIVENDDKTALQRCTTYDNYYDWRSVEVIVETVCEFTGLLDKNGKPIFEGDIITANIGTNEQEDEILSSMNIEVTFSKGVFYPFGYACGFRSWVDDIIIVGNKYDNPELLEE